MLGELHADSRDLLVGSVNKEMVVRDFLADGESKRVTCLPETLLFLGRMTVEGKVVLNFCYMRGAKDATRTTVGWNHWFFHIRQFWCRVVDKKGNPLYPLADFEELWR